MTTRRSAPRQLVASLLFGAGLLGALAACSAIVDTRATQCDVDADCAALGEAFSGTTCTNHVCVSPSTLSCTSNKQCSDQLGEVAVCNKATSTCAAVVSSLCPNYLGDPSDVTDHDNVFLIGLINPLTGEDQGIGLPVQNGAEIARREIMQAVNGIQPDVTKPAIPIALLGCDETDAIGSAKHLVNDLGVQAIIGPQFSQNVIDVATTVTVPAGVMLISPTATATEISKLNDHALVFRTAPPDRYQAAAVNQYMKQLEPKVRTARGLDASAKLKVAVLFKGDTYGVGFSTILSQTLMVNGEIIAQDAASYVGKDYGADGNSTDPPRYDDVVNATTAFAPDIIVGIGTTELVTQIFTPIETKWTAQDHRPYWILTDGAVGPDIVTAVGSNADLRGRVRGTTPGTTNPASQALITRYNTIFEANVPPETFGVAGAYDSVYIYFYDALLAHVDGTTPYDKSPTGVDLTSEMAFQNDGPPTVNVGTDDLSTGISAYLSDEDIDLEGASGNLDFDANGDPPSDIQIWCLDTLGSDTAQKVSYSGFFVSFDDDGSSAPEGADGCK